jgi:hypothetical protein
VFEEGEADCFSMKINGRERRGGASGGVWVFVFSASMIFFNKKGGENGWVRWSKE